MLPARIGLASRSADVDFAALVRVASALNIQISRDAGPIWGISATVAALPDPEHIDPGVWPVYIVDDLDPALGGVHQTDHNQPFALVESGDTWSLTASHETLEMLVDPSGNRLVAAPAIMIADNEIKDTDGKFEYLVEVCDPSEDQSCAYLIDGVLVSDFFTPSYFDPTGTAGARYSFSGKLTRPRHVLPNGYLSWYNPGTNKLQQVRHFGAPQIVTLGTGAPGTGKLSGNRPLRGFVDSLTIPPHALSKLHASSSAVKARDLRQSFLASAAPARASMYGVALTAAMAPPPPPPPAPDVQALLHVNMAHFSQPGVVSVRTGFHFGVNGMTGEPAIVVTVLPERMTALTASMPSSIEGVPVDVRPADLLQRMRSLHPTQYMAMASARHELRQPDFADEVFFDQDGKPMQQGAALSAFEASRPHKEQIPYAPPPDATLDAVTRQMTLLLHCSPDAGWAKLSEFIAGIEQSLVVGMYDFTSAHILDALETAMAGGKKLTLTLDHPAPNPSRDQTDEATVSDLTAKLGGDFAGAWALTNSDRMATKWIYPNAYHIKVAVRDDGTFWLSSGNWNNSNQPEIDLTDLAAARKIAAGHDRDWHVIATSPELADTFRKFLQNDFAIASQNNVSGIGAAMATGSAEPDPEVPAAVLGAGRSPRHFFAPKTVSGVIQIQPLLTPDNYQPNVKALIQSATQKFYMQTQYIHPSEKDGDEGHAELIAAVKALVDSGVDVRLITSEFQTDAWVEKLVAAGIPGSVLRRQNKVHNKGVVVDGSVCMVSSQNWSADGTLRNRDAGLIIHNADAAVYFEGIFLHDWDNLAAPVMAG